MSFQTGIYYIFTSFGSGDKCIDMPTQNINDNDGDVQKFNSNSGYTQKWNFIEDTSRPGRFLIKWNYAEKYLEIEDNSNDDGKKIRFNKRINNAYQSWYVEEADNGRFYILNDGSGKAIDYESAENNPGDPIRQKTKANYSEQKWFLRPAQP